MLGDMLGDMLGLILGDILGDILGEILGLGDTLGLILGDTLGKTLNDGLLDALLDALAKIDDLIKVDLKTLGAGIEGDDTLIGETFVRATEGDLIGLEGKVVGVNETVRLLALDTKDKGVLVIRAELEAEGIKLVGC